MRLLSIVGAVWICTSALAGEAPRTSAQSWADHYADLYRVPPALVHAIIDIESNWQPNATSPRGATGLMQLMPATAAAFGVKDRFDVEQNIRGGVAYLAHLIRRFGSDLRLVAAAYIAGENAVAARGLRYSNAEVYHYVLRVRERYRAQAELALNPAQK